MADWGDCTGGVLEPYLLMVGLQTTDSASDTLILNLEDGFTALLAWFAFKENFDRRIAFGMALIAGGSVVLSLGPTLRGGGVLGLLAIAGACLAWAIDNNLTRKISVHEAMMIACSKGLVAGTTSVAMALPFGAHLPQAVSGNCRTRLGRNRARRPDRHLARNRGVSIMAGVNKRLMLAAGVIAASRAIGTWLHRALG